MQARHPSDSSALLSKMQLQAEMHVTLCLTSVKVLAETCIRDLRGEQAIFCKLGSNSASNHILFYCGHSFVYNMRTKLQHIKIKWILYENLVLGDFILLSGEVLQKLAFAKKKRGEHCKRSFLRGRGSTC